MRTANLVTGLVAILFGLVMYRYIIPNQVMDLGGFGMAPQTFPRVAAGVMAFFGGVLVVQQFSPGSRDATPSPMALPQWYFLLLITAMLLVAVLMLTYLGFVWSAPLMIAAFMLFAGCRAWVKIVLVAVSLPALLYVVFWLLLEIPLP